MTVLRTPTSSSSGNWQWQPGWAPRQDPAFNAQWVNRWLDDAMGNALPDLLNDPRWDPSCRWVPEHPPVVSCGWEGLLLDDPRVPVSLWADRLHDRRYVRWSTFPDTNVAHRNGITSSWLDVVLSDPPHGGWFGVNPSTMARRVALVHALGRPALQQGFPDPLRTGWFVQPDSGRTGLLNRTASNGALYPLAHALLDLGATLAVRRQDGSSDADEWLSQVKRLPGNEEVKANWPALLVRGLRTVPLGPEWTAWKHGGHRGIVQRCVIEAAQAVEAKALRQAVMDQDLLMHSGEAPRPRPRL